MGLTWTLMRKSGLQQDPALQCPSTYIATLASASAKPSTWTWTLMRKSGLQQDPAFQCPSTYLATHVDADAQQQPDEARFELQWSAGTVTQALLHMTFVRPPQLHMA